MAVNSTAIIDEATSETLPELGYEVIRSFLSQRGIMAEGEYSQVSFGEETRELKEPRSVVGAEHPAGYCTNVSILPEGANFNLTFTKLSQSNVVSSAIRQLTDIASQATTSERLERLETRFTAILSPEELKTMLKNTVKLGHSHHR